MNMFAAKNPKNMRRFPKPTQLFIQALQCVHTLIKSIHECANIDQLFPAVLRYSTVAAEVDCTGCPVRLFGIKG